VFAHRREMAAAVAALAGIASDLDGTLLGWYWPLLACA
jgi:hypothetical protein